MSANGQRTNSNNVQIDGITDMDTGNNGGPMVALSLDSVQEVKLLTSNSKDFKDIPGLQMVVLPLP